MTSTGAIGLKSVTTHAELLDIISDPTFADTCPTEHDARYFLARVYSEVDASGILLNKLNWARSLDQLNIVRVVSKTYGDNDTAFAGAGTDDGPVVLIGLPTPENLFKIVWGIVPGFVKSKVIGWAKANMDGPIASEITSYVKRGLGMLPLPIPAFFVNAVTNLVIPPLVAYIIKNVANLSTLEVAATHASSPFPRHTAKTQELMKHFDRKILLAAGLEHRHLPAHLKVKVAAGDDDDLNVQGQPDDRDARTDMEQFYQSDVPNGCKPLQLTQIISAQIRTNPACDPDAGAFGSAVWKSLDSDTKTKLRKMATADPVDQAGIADTVYTPTRLLLMKSPYNVPNPILDSFTTIKTPEVTEYVITEQGNV